MARIPFFGKADKTADEGMPSAVASFTNDDLRHNVNHRSPFTMIAGIKDVVTETNKLRDDSNFDNDFYLFDEMLKLDPELNGAVRAVSLTANNYTINWSSARNARIRTALQDLVEKIDFDDILINAMRNLMVYGNDISKLVGTGKEGITNVQSLPVSQITILDDRNRSATADDNDPVITVEKYFLREGETTMQEFPADEILHIRMDYRSNWFTDNETRTTYGIWGASRFTALKQAIRAKYNSMNNRISLEDAMTKQYISINMDAVKHIQNPDEQRERLLYIMNQVISTMESLRGDQVPIFPDYVQIKHIDQRTALPDSSGFLDNVNADIAAVLQVPRTAAGQEKGSTFAASYTANLWASNAIRRIQTILKQSMNGLFSAHLDLLGIEHTSRDLPVLTFEPVDEETRLDKMRRATLGYGAGLLSLNQSLDIVSLPLEEDGDVRTGQPTSAPTEETPPVDEEPRDEDEDLPREGEM
tara:strand:+ start:2230 stop:3651 length:1422 start_codon:yes stop_codon:yes gene_type:complete